MLTDWDRSDLHSHVRGILELLGLDIEDENFRETPQRFSRFLEEFTQRSAPEIKVFPSCSTNMIQLDNFEVYGLCPHHLLPVRYNITIRYQPNGKVFGISKLPRVASYMLRSLPLQEDLPKLIVDYLFDLLDVRYGFCLVEGEHLCMIMRGVKAHNCSLTTVYERSAPDGEVDVCEVN